MLFYNVCHRDYLSTQGPVKSHFDGICWMYYRLIEFVLPEKNVNWTNDQELLRLFDKGTYLGSLILTLKNVLIFSFCFPPKYDYWNLDSGMTWLNFFFGSDSLYWEWFNWLHSWGLSSFIFTSHLLESKFKLPKKIACNDTKSKKVQFGEVKLFALSLIFLIVKLIHFLITL